MNTLPTYLPTYLINLIDPAGHSASHLEFLAGEG